jgi:hypothetical protein
MLKWLADKFFGKRTARTAALDAYLDQFSPGELATINNLALSGIQFSILSGRDPFPDIDLSTHIHAALLAKQGRIGGSLSDLASARVSIRNAITKGTIEQIKAMRSGAFHEPLLQFYEPSDDDQEDDDQEDDDRLNDHVTMLKRIYHDDNKANLLPSLERYNEGKAWEQKWRNAYKPSGS